MHNTIHANEDDAPIPNEVTSAHPDLKPGLSLISPLKHWSVMSHVRRVRPELVSDACTLESVNVEGYHTESWSSSYLVNRSCPPERSTEDAPRSRGLPGLLLDKYRLASSIPQDGPTSIQQQLLPLQQHIAPRGEGKNSIEHGGPHSLQQSRLISYLSPSRGSHARSSLARQLPARPFSRSCPPQLPPLLTNEASASGNIGEQRRGERPSVSACLKLWSASSLCSRVLSALSPQGTISQRAPSPRYAPHSQGKRFNPPSTSYPEVLVQQVTSHPHVCGYQKLLPSMPPLCPDTGQCTIVGQSPPPVSPRRASRRSRAGTLPIAALPVASSSIATALDATSLDDSNRLPQSLRGDPFRSAKVKTELCRYYNTPKGCIFGDKCNYAHGEDDLKFNKLMDLEAAGLIDVEVFRCHVCFTWVMTGACPFGKRCTRLHDPRVISMHPPWLAHAEVSVTGTKKGVEVDKMFHQHYCSIYSCSPIYGFAPKERWKADSANSAWREFYCFACNMDATQPYSQQDPWYLSPRRSTTVQNAEITEMHRLAIVLMMRKRRNAQCFTYCPSHSFCGVLCMVLQTAHFKLVPVLSSQHIVRYEVVEASEEEVSHSIEAREGGLIIIAREIAFGPVADASVRPVSIWFNVKPQYIEPYVRRQGRRHKQSRHRLGVKRNHENRPEEMKINASCSIPPFTSHQPMDDIAFNLISRIQNHRYLVLKYFSSDPDVCTGDSLAREEQELQRSFESQRRFWMTWTWPKKIGSHNIEGDAAVPGVDGTYNFVAYGDLGFGQDSLFFGFDQQDRNNIGGSRQLVSKQAKLATGLIWKSFVANLQLVSGQVAADLTFEECQMPTHDPILSRIRRIPTLRKLSLGSSPIKNSSRKIPMLGARVATSWDLFIREWALMQRQSKETSSSLLKYSKQDFSRRRPFLYPFPFGLAAHRWFREVPEL